jgi:tyrosyl-tRNA synthetase
MKKAFCEPGNVDFCPPIHLASVFAFGPTGSGSLTVSRSPENGGNLTYTGVDNLSKDFISGALHPGDLKAATTALAATVLDQLAKAVNADKDTKQAVKALKNYQKKAAKSKK